MKSFQNFAYNILEAETRTGTRVNVSGPEILPMQPEGETSPSTTKAKVIKVGRKTRPRPSTIDKRFQSAIKKGYRTPSGEITPRGIQTYYARQQGQGYGDPGKELKGGQETLKKANELTKNITPEKKKTIKSIVKKIETKYPTPPDVQKSTPLGFRKFSQSVETQNRPAVNTQEPSPRTPAAQQAFKDIKSYGDKPSKISGEKLLKSLVGDPKTPIFKPSTTPLSPTAAKVKPKPKLKVTPKTIDLGTTKIPELPKLDKGAALKVSTPQAATTADDLASAATKVMKQMNIDRAAEKAQKALKTAKTWRATGGVLGVAGAGLEAKSGYEQARKEGAGKKRAFGAGAARALGGLTGGAIGSAVGTGLGLPGAIGGGIAGYKYGADAGTAAYKALTGDYGKKVTTQSVLSNVRKTVPYSIRSQVPAGARKAFRDLVTQTGRSYGQWSRSQGGNK